MTRTQSGLTATTHERRRFRLLIRLAKAGFGGQTPRELIRHGGSIERPAFEAELELLMQTGIIETTVEGVERYRLTKAAADAIALLFPGQPFREPSEFVWKPPGERPSDPPAAAEVVDAIVGLVTDSTPEKTWWELASDDGIMPVAEAQEREGFWSTPENFWDTAADRVMSVAEAREREGFWS